MSFYRTIIATVAAMGLGFATSALAADDATQPNSDTKAMQTADANTTTTNTTSDTGMTNTSSDQNNQNQNMQGATTDAKVNINTATAKELMKVKGLSASKAKAIVAYRKKHGDFKSVDEIKEVKGFKKMNEDQMKKLADQLTV